ncbi:ATP GTP-binding protein, putative [Babesia ovata]|uniref:ATP GTP-binding protein, putative n=1 Tax=Babesia ovata TaxID=189622 RepID=A0A2H6K8U0_9APIC|nr:ATP GTP-binding protein, putative [Babesia ovata]GBE59400.1 ATP GTP-binding protein, putative [Babesia ovata]
MEQQESEPEAEHVALTLRKHVLDVLHNVLKREYMHVHTDEPLGAEGLGHQEALQMIVKLLVTLLQQPHEHPGVTHVGLGSARKIPTKLVLMEVYYHTNNVGGGQEEGQEGNHEPLALVVVADVGEYQLQVSAQNLAVLLRNERALGIQAEYPLVFLSHLETGFCRPRQRGGTGRGAPQITGAHQRADIIHNRAQNVISAGAIAAAEQRLDLRAQRQQLIRRVQAAAVKQRRLAFLLPQF